MSFDRRTRILCKMFVHDLFHLARQYVSGKSVPCAHLILLCAAIYSSTLKPPQSGGGFLIFWRAGAIHRQLNSSDITSVFILIGEDSDVVAERFDLGMDLV